MNEVKLPEGVESRKVESTKEASMRLTMCITNAQGLKNETAIVLAPLFQSTNKSATVSFLTISSYIKSQKDKDGKTEFNDKAYVLLSALDDLNTIQFFDASGEEVTLFTSGIKERETRSGISYLTITWYLEDSKTVLGFKPTATLNRFDEFLSELNRQAEAAKAKAAK